MFSESYTSPRSFALWTGMIVWDLHWARTHSFFFSCHCQQRESYSKFQTWNLKNWSFGGLWYFWLDLCDHCVYEPTNNITSACSSCSTAQNQYVSAYSALRVYCLGISNKSDEGHECSGFTSDGHQDLLALCQQEPCSSGELLAGKKSSQGTW